MQNFEIVATLGEGTYSTVYKVKRHSDDKNYAMKKVKITQLDKEDKRAALNEIRILASIDHKNVIQYKEAFFDESSGHLCIVMELADSGDLKSKVEKARELKQFVKEDKIWHIFRQLLEGLQALH